MNKGAIPVFKIVYSRQPLNNLIEAIGKETKLPHNFGKRMLGGGVFTAIEKCMKTKQQLTNN